ncbi:MAG: hypothetical protein JWP25_4090 [Bradyrhizobium sp.]|jgi:hypothetical protein|nr:hypothetical protein [Bradyrhizobium sp.]MEA2868331.1 hypothetical protein [Bradyrhizobium sp.]
MLSDCGNSSWKHGSIHSRVCAAAGSDDCAAQNLKNYAASINAEFPDEQVSVLLSALGARP